MKKSTVSGATPTTTRNIDHFKVNTDPKIFVYDTPGIMPPKVDSYETGLKLSVTGNIKDKILGVEVIADYTLFLLNKKKVNEYVTELKLKAPVNTIDELWEQMTVNYKFASKNDALTYFMKKFREGDLGKLTIDESGFSKII